MEQVYLPYVSFRLEFIGRARAEHKHGLLVCSQCGWSWLTDEDGNVDMDGSVCCLDVNECLRRRLMNMKPPSASRRKKAAVRRRKK